MGEMKKMKKWTGIAALVIICLLAASGVTAMTHGEKAAKKVGILLVAFGSSEESAQVSFDNIDKKNQSPVSGHTGPLGVYVEHHPRETRQTGNDAGLAGSRTGQNAG